MQTVLDPFSIVTVFAPKAGKVAEIQQVGFNVPTPVNVTVRECAGDRALRTAKEIKIASWSLLIGTPRTFRLLRWNHRRRQALVR